MHSLGRPHHAARVVHALEPGAPKSNVARGWLWVGLLTTVIFTLYRRKIGIRIAPSEWSAPPERRQWRGSRTRAQR